MDHDSRCASEGLGPSAEFTASGARLPGSMETMNRVADCVERKLLDSGPKPSVRGGGGNDRCARESSWAATQPMRVRGLGLARKLGQIAPERPRNVIVPFSFFPTFFSSLSNSI